MLENRVSFKKFLVALVLCSVSVVLFYQWRVKYFTIRFVSWNSTNSNSTSLMFDTAWRLPLPAVDHLDFIMNSTKNKIKTVMGNTNSSKLIKTTNTTVHEETNKTTHQASTNTSFRPNVIGKKGQPGKVDTTTTPVSTNTTVTTNATTTTPRPVLTTTPKPDTCKDPFRKDYREKRHFLCCRPVGGLGNNMFVYASAYGIATRLNRTLVVSNSSNINKVFNVTGHSHVVNDYECVVRGSKGKSARIDCGFDKGFFEIPRGDNYCVGMYLQSYKYFEHVKDDIRKQFSFQKETRDKAKNIIDTAVDSYRQKSNKTDQSQRPVLVGVHVRRGDLVNNKYGYDVATPEYMDKAMKYFRGKYGFVLFIVCSNGMEWVKKNVVGNDVVYVEGNKFDVDMSVLVSCDHTLSTVGSFSWWVGYLTGGETIYYQWPAKEGSALRKHYSKDYSDFFPPTWIGMR